MQRKVLGLTLAIALCLTAVAQAIPTIVVGNHNLLPNTAGQLVPILVSGISANEVNGITLSAMVNGGGVPYGGTPGPTITGMDFDSPSVLPPAASIWIIPQTTAGHNAPATFFDNQLASANFLTVSGFVLVNGGLVAQLTIDTSGFNSGVFNLDLLGLALEENVGNTGFIGNITAEDITGGTLTIIPIPEPSSLVLGMFAIAGLGAVAIRKRRARRA